MRRILKSRHAKVISWFVVFSFVFTFLPAKESLADALTKNIKRWRLERQGRSWTLTLTEMRALKGGQEPIPASNTVSPEGAPASWEGSDPASPFSQVNVNSGNLFTPIPIAGFAGRGLDVSLTLHHNSSDLNSSSPLSAGWTHAYHVTLTVDWEMSNGNVTVREGTGRKHTFIRNADGSYTHPPGVFETLVQNPDSTYTLTRPNQVKLNFDSQNRLSTIVDPNNNTVTLSYNGQGQLTSITEASGKSLTIAYDGNERITSVTNPLNQTTTFTYDDFTGYLVTVTYPDTTTLQFTYDIQGRIWSITDPRGNVWDYDYDFNGRLTQAHHPGTAANAYRTYTWLENGVDVTDQTGKTVGYRKDANGNLSQVIIDPYGLALTPSYGYDSQHDRTSVTNPNGYGSTMTYSNGNMTGATDPLNRTTTMTYDTQNRLLTVTDNANHTTTYTYDAMGNLTQVSDALGNLTTYTYDAYGNRLTQTLNGHTTTFGYDTTGNLISIQDALGNTTSFGYNALGWRTSRTDALGRTTSYGYDSVGRLITITYPDSSQTTFAYDAAGNRVQMVDGTGTTTWTYNARNLVTSESRGGANITYTYDDAGRLISQTDQAGVTTTYSYDAAGRLVSVTAAGKTTSYEYDVNSRLITQTNPNEMVTTFTYNNADELTSVLHKKSDNTILSQLTYTYNSDGLRSQLSETLGSQTATVTYTYDALHRLTDEVRTGADVYENHYTYDAAGNRLTWNDGVGTTTYTYDAADRLTQEGTTTYTYNANGSRVSKTLSGSTTNYSYNYDEQLTQVASPTTGTSSFTYDGLGRRVTRTAGGVTTTFYYSGNNITTETQDSTVVAHYVYGVNRISRDASGSYEYYHNDVLGSTRQVSSDTQSITQTTTYDAFGNIESSMGSSNNAYRFAGQYGYRSDGDDGLMHVGVRYYDPLVGRFITADTWLGMTARPQSLNRYAYCENDPVNLVDPTGHSGKKGSSPISCVDYNGPSGFVGSDCYWAWVAYGVCWGDLPPFNWVGMKYCDGTKNCSPLIGRPGNNVPNPPLLTPPTPPSIPWWQQPFVLWNKTNIDIGFIIISRE